ncbi:MAG: glycosyltransferase family 2 protein [Ignavibacteriales bacterium]|nr:glycosyltransferase family 2 protein [Ignavibacteriales bacterium]
MKKISVIIITKNEEENIFACLESIKWADEIILVDSGSTDKTVEIAKRFTDRIYINEWRGFAKQKEYALSLTLNEWVLSIDADERVSDELKIEIENIDTEDVDGYYILRDNYFLGKKITSCGWNNDYQLRLFNKKKTKVNQRLVHEGFDVDSNTKKMKNPILHFTHTSLEKSIEKINHYTTLEAIEIKNKRKVGSIRILLRGFSAFFRFYISKKGFKDGFAGFSISMLNAFTSIQTNMKVWELKQKEKMKVNEEKNY